MAIPPDVRAISDELNYYGFITGLGVERVPEWTVTAIISDRLYATFEWEGETSVWLVPDSELFGELAPHLVRMADSRCSIEGLGAGEYGESQLWIGRTDDRWEVAVGGYA